MKMVLIETCSSLSNLFYQLVVISMYIQVNFPTVYMIIMLSLSPLSPPSPLSLYLSLYLSLNPSLIIHYLKTFNYLGIHSSS